MPTVIASDVVRISHVGRWTNGREIVNVDHWFVDFESTLNRAEEVVDFVGAVCDAWQARLVNVLFPDNYTYLGADYLDMDSITGVSGRVSRNDGGIGAAAQIPPALSVVVNKVAPGTRTQRNGRAFLPTTAEAGVDENGIVDPTTLAQIVTAYAAHVADVKLYSPGPGAINDTEHVLVSYDRDDDDPIVTASVRPIVAYSGRALVGRQGRRMTG